MRTAITEYMPPLQVSMRHAKLLFDKLKNTEDFNVVGTYVSKSMFYLICNLRLVWCCGHVNHSCRYRYLFFTIVIKKKNTHKL